MAVARAGKLGPIGGKPESTLRAHWPLAAALAAGLALRIAVAIAYEPGLFFSDSWSYVRLAFSPGFAPDRPSGYPLVIALLSLPGRELGVVTAAQHLAGLASGALAYFALLRLGAPRWAGAAAAAVVVLDLYAISLEQFVMAEAFFTFALMASAWLAIRRESGPALLALSGVLLAGAATMRTLGLFAVPAWLVYVAWSRRRVRAILPAAVGLLLPLLAYAGVHAADGKGFGFSQVGGWALYSRVAPFADCDGADIPEDTRGLCEEAAERQSSPNHYGWAPDSPANRLYGAHRVEGNDRLRAFGSAIVRHQPLDYAEAIARDFLKFFTPGVDPPQASGGLREPILLPAPGDAVFSSPFGDSVKAEYFPGYERRIRAPAAALRDLQRVLHTSKLLLALMTLAAIVSVLLPGRPRKRETFLFAGMALAMLAGAAAVEYQVRYLVPVAPLLVCAGAAALLDLAGRPLRDTPDRA